MATAQLGFSFNSSQFLSEMFRSMFPDSQIAVDYSLRERKLSYVISHGTGYYFTNELIKDVRKAYGFSLLFDETSIAGVRKQLDIFFRYWSEAKNCICVRFYKSIILGHVTADIISRSIIDSLKADGIDITKMLMLADDRSSLNEASINGLRVTNAGVKFFGGGKVHMVPTTATLISNAQEAHSRYMKDNEEQQKLIRQIDVVNGKRASDAEHERLEENEIELLNKQKNL
ncbi:unnamed protein product [Rotaria sp. Silwood2]|nr:unnamed protein product [Rotaria sp. Silwood2]